MGTNRERKGPNPTDNRELDDLDRLVRHQNMSESNRDSLFLGLVDIFSSHTAGDRKNIGIITAFLTFLFPFICLVNELFFLKSTGLLFNYLIPSLFLLTLIPLIYFHGITPKVFVLLALTIYTGFILSLFLPGTHNVHVLLFFTAVPLFYILGGLRLGRRSSFVFLFLILALIVLRLSGLIVTWNLAKAPETLAMAVLAVVIQMVVADVVEVRHRKQIMAVIKAQHFDVSSGLPNKKTLLYCTCSPGSHLLLIKLTNLAEISDLTGLNVAPGALESFIRFLGGGEYRQTGMVQGPFSVSDEEAALLLPPEIVPRVFIGKLMDFFARLEPAGGSILRVVPSFNCCQAGAFTQSAERLLTQARGTIAQDYRLRNLPSFLDSLPTPENLGMVRERTHELLRNIKEQSMKAVFQPVYDIETDGIGFLEALLRFDRGGVMVSPEDYLEIVYRLGLERHISEFILDQAVFTARSTGYSVSFNVTFRDLESESFLLTLLEGCAQFRDSPNKLIVELTEQVVFSDLDRVRSLVTRVHGVGGMVFLDDFGSGYSNYASVLDIEFDGVKITGEIGKRISEDPKAAVLYDGIAAFCQTAGVGFIVEHVSDAPILDRALQSGARYLQGYFFSQPTTMSELQRTGFGFPTGYSTGSKPYGPRESSLTDTKRTRPGETFQRRFPDRVQ